MKEFSGSIFGLNMVHSETLIRIYNSSLYVLTFILLI